MSKILFDLPSTLGSPGFSRTESKRPRLGRDQLLWVRKEGFVPNPDFTSKLEASFPNKLVPIVVGCQSGARSTPATVMMLHEGYFELPPEESRLVSPTEASDLVTKGWQYLDVRTEEEFSHGHAPGAANIPFFLKGKEGFVPNPDFTSKLEASFPNKLVPIVVGCQSGARSTPATVMMLHEGYANLRNMEGGFPAWVKEGLPSVVEVIEDEGL
eukprot:gene9657-8479_t